MARITREEVHRVAMLARLALSDTEADRVTGELESILGYVEQLQGLATDEVEPLAHVLPMATPLRADRADPPLDPEQAVANAPDRDGTAFRVPQVIETEG